MPLPLPLLQLLLLELQDQSRPDKERICELLLPRNEKTLVSVASDTKIRYIHDMHGFGKRRREREKKRKCASKIHVNYDAIARTSESLADAR